MKVLSLLLVLGTSLFAQTRTAQVSGFITDASGGAVPQASINVSNTETGAKHQAKSSDAGEYTVPLLDPGSYEISVEHSGFRTVQRSGIVLHVGDSVKLDFSLQIGDVSQTVSVTADAPLLSTTDAALGQVINNTEVTSLPLNGRSSFRLVELAPGFLGAPAAQGQFQDIPVNTTWDANFSINGGQGYSNEIMIDGAPSTTGFFNQISTMPSVDALVEFKVQASAMSAEFGRFGGGLLNVTTKSGTNNVHGSLFEFLRNSALGANDFFNNLAGNPRVPFRMNQFGGSVGGPLEIPKLYNGKNRTFYFFNYEGTRWRRGANFSTTVPTAAERNGDFSHDVTNSGALVVIYDPLSSTTARTAFPGNVIPANRINAISKALAAYYPLPNTAGQGLAGTSNYVSNAGSGVDKDQINFRIDQQLTANQKIFGRVSSDVTDLCQPNTYGNVASPAGSSVGCTTWKNRSATLEHDATLSPNLLLTIRYGFARWYQIRAGRSYGFDQTTLGFPASLIRNEQIPGFPTINVNGYGGLGNQGNNYLSNGNDTHSLLPALTIVHGRQVIKIGADMRMARINFFNPSSPGGVYAFTQAFTQGPNPLQGSTTAGDSFASLLLGFPNSGSVTVDPGVSLQNFYFSGYFQDDIKVTTKLTVNAGLRYETESPYTERHNRLVGFDTHIPSPVRNAAFPNLEGALRFADANNRYVYDWPMANFGPRLGLAYQAGKSTTVRAGAGLFYAPLQISNNAVGFAPTNGYSQSTPLVASNNGGITPAATLSNPFPSGIIAPSGSALGAATYLGQGITVWDSHPQTPRSVQWNFSLQQQLRNSILLEAAYVGNRGTHLAGERELNTLPSQDMSLGSSLLQLVPNPFYTQINVGNLANPTITRSQLLRPFPQFTGLDILNATAGNSSYHSLQVKAEKRMSKGLQVLVSYTFAKLITDVPWAASGIGGNNGSGAFEDWNNLHNERSLSAQDVSQALAISYTYALPGHFKGPAQWVIGGWEVNGITRLQTGTPLGLTTSTNSTNSLGGGSRPNTNGQDPNLPDNRAEASKISQWFNTAAFTIPPTFTFGNVSRTLPATRAPGLTNFDFSAFKNFKIRERATLQFRAEFFNLFNHPQFSPPAISLGDKQFGTISSTAVLPRVGQMALKLTF